MPLRFFDPLVFPPQQLPPLSYLDKGVLFMEARGEQKQRDGILRMSVELLMSLVFLCLIGCLFVASSVLLGKYELLILAYVLLAASIVRPMLSNKQLKRLEEVAIIGEGIKIFSHLERFYLREQPRSIFFYLFFPVTGVISFFLSKDRGRRELKAHFILVQWIVVLLLAGGFASYSRFYQHFPWKTATTWLYMELLTVYFLCNFFAIPVATSTLRMSVAGRRFRLVVVSAMGILVMTVFLFYYKSGARYDNLIPVNIAMDFRMAALKQQVALSQGKKPLHSFATTQKKKNEKPQFFDELQDATEMFIRFQAPRILAFNQENFFSGSIAKHAAFVRELNETFQAHIQRLCAFGEHEHIFLTVTQEPQGAWGMVVMPFRENLFYTFRLSLAGAHFYRRWVDMPPSEQAQFAQRWDKNLYRFAAEKRFARVIVDTMRDLASKSAPAPEEKSKSDESAPRRTRRGRPSVAQRARRRSDRARQYAEPPAAISPVMPSEPAKESIRQERFLPTPAPVSPPSPSLGRLARPKSSSSTDPTRSQKRGGFGKAEKQKKLSDAPSADAPTQPLLLDREQRQRLIQKAKDLSDAFLKERAEIEQLYFRLLKHFQLFGLKIPLPVAIGDQPLSASPTLYKLWQPTWLDDLDPTKNLLHPLVAQHNAIHPQGSNGSQSLFFMLESARADQIAKKLEDIEKNDPSTLTHEQTDERDRVVAELKRGITHQLALSQKQRYQKSFLEKLEELLKSRKEPIQRTRKNFVLYDETLRELHLARALSARLLYDHFGATPPLPPLWWATLYEQFLRLMLFLFQMTMPLHLLLIFYCHVRLREPESED